MLNYPKFRVDKPLPCQGVGIRTSRCTSLAPSSSSRFVCTCPPCKHISSRNTTSVQQIRIRGCSETRNTRDETQPRSSPSRFLLNLASQHSRHVTHIRSWRSGSRDAQLPSLPPPPYLSISTLPPRYPPPLHPEKPQSETRRGSTDSHLLSATPSFSSSSQLP